MNKNLKIALIVAGIIAIIYFWNKKNTDESEKSEFLGGLFRKKGSQSWANGLAARYCRLIDQLKKVVAEMAAQSSLGNPQSANSLRLIAAKMKIEAELQSILESLSKYAYQIDTTRCVAIFKGGPSGRIYKPGDQLGKDCLCKDKTTWAPECCKAAK